MEPLNLASPEWAKLPNAYGFSSQIPLLLQGLTPTSKSEGTNEPWFSLWSALAHQGDVYAASFAAVPHVVNILSKAPESADASFFQFPAWIEICRNRHKIEVPQNLRDAYFLSLKKLPELVSRTFAQDWDNQFSACAIAAIAVGKGSWELAEATLDLSPDMLPLFRSWLYSR